ncbi:MAG: maleylpyruvate isomerase N-terminal domain-containing protein [Actinomycetota bacterium]
MITQGAADRGQVSEAIATLAGRIASLITDLPDTSIAIPKMQWSVGDAAAHLAFAQEFFARVVAGEQITHGDGTMASLAHANRSHLMSEKERRGSVLAERMVNSTQEFLLRAAALPSSSLLQTPMGRMDLDALYAYQVTHLMMHGFQLAAALRTPLVVERRVACMAIPFIKHSLPLVVDPRAAGNLTATYQVKPRGGLPFWVVVAGGAATVHDSRPGRVDCYLSADPVAFMQVGFRLKSQWPQIARFKLVAWGRKPWLALRFAGLFVPP